MLGIWFLSRSHFSFSIFICREVERRPAVTLMDKIRQMAPLYEIKLLNPDE